MSRITLSGNPSGTGTFTIASPNSNTDRTLTLPNASGTLNTSGAPNEVPAGSAAAPAIYPTGDTNTGIFFPAADTIAFAEGGAEVMRIDSSGNLGLKVTPSASWQAGRAVMQIGPAMALDCNNQTQALVSANRVFTGSQDLYLNSGNATAYQQFNGAHSWFTAPSGTAGNAISFTQAMTLDVSGNLLVGTTSALGKVTVSGGKTALSSTDSSFGQLQIGNPANGGEASIAFFSGATAFGQSPTSVNGNQFLWAAGAGIYGIGGNSWGIGNLAASNFVARVNWNSTSWIFSSDERLKDVEGRVENALDKVSVLRPVYFTWKNDEAKERKVGLLAQDVLQVLPEAVAVPEQETREDGTPNYLGLSMSDVVPLLVAAIQELKADLDATKAELAALKGQA
jgi:hypothetical protein